MSRRSRPGSAQRISRPGSYRDRATRPHPIAPRRAGRDAITGGVAAAVVGFAVSFAVVGTWTNPVLEFNHRVFPALPAALVVAAAFAYDNEGLLVSILLTALPTYAFFVHGVHLGNTGPVPYPRAAVIAVVVTFVVGASLDLAGGVLGIAARRFVDRFRTARD